MNNILSKETLKLKDATREVAGMAFLWECLPLATSVGRELLLNRSFMTEAPQIEAELSNLQSIITAVGKDANTKNTAQKIAVHLGHVTDVRGSLSRLESGMTLTDVDFFEIKSFALLAQEIRSLANELQLPFILLPNLLRAITLLDPEGKRIPHFYIYNAYSPRLTELRAQLELLINNKASEDAVEEFRFTVQEEEDRVRESLSEQLAPHVAPLRSALQEVARLDIYLAQASQSVALGLVRPQILPKGTPGAFRGLFSPDLQSSLASQGKQYQPVDISLTESPTLITGANMSGKSVLLRSVALAQTLTQFGFFVPAREAQVEPMDGVAVCMGDTQDAHAGLSSYAAEMLGVNRIAQAVLSGKRLLVLIDELARTTNPIEGAAIVQGVLDFLAEHSVCALVTSHYAVHTPCRKLRIKGFTGSREMVKSIRPEQLNSYIDYSLEETREDRVPHEALLIAEIMGVTPALLQKIKPYVEADYTGRKERID